MLVDTSDREAMAKANAGGGCPLEEQVNSAGRTINIMVQRGPRKRFQRLATAHLLYIYRSIDILLWLACGRETHVGDPRITLYWHQKLRAGPRSGSSANVVGHRSVKTNLDVNVITQPSISALSPATVVLDSRHEPVRSV